MITLDFSRVGEIFYRKIGEKGIDNDLPTLIQLAKEKYDELRITGCLNNPAKKAEFLGVLPDYFISLMLFNQNNKASVDSIKIAGQINNLGILLGKIYGNIEAIFDNYSLDEKSPFYKEFEKTSKRVFERDGFQIYLKKENSSGRIYVQRIFTQRPNILLEKREDCPNYEKRYHSLLNHAGRICIENSFHLGNMPQRDKLCENSVIVIENPQLCTFNYQIISASGSELPKEAEDFANEIYSLIQDKFAKKREIKFNLSDRGHHD
jgi:hypothetical protein